MLVAPQPLQPLSAQPRPFLQHDPYKVYGAPSYAPPAIPSRVATPADDSYLPPTSALSQHYEAGRNVTAYADGMRDGDELDKLLMAFLQQGADLRGS